MILVWLSLLLISYITPIKPFTVFRGTYQTSKIPIIVLDKSIQYGYSVEYKECDATPISRRNRKLRMAHEISKISQIEDDGYSLAQGKRNIWQKMKAKMTPVQPGTLILIRHGESVLNFNRTFTGS